MVDEQKDTREPELLDDDLVQKSSSFWLGLAAIPVILTLIVSIFISSTPEPEETQLQTPQANVEKTVQPQEELRVLNSKRSRNKNVVKSSKVKTYFCNFSDYVGRKYSKALHEELKLTKRPLLFFEENGGKTSTLDSERINIYLNAQKIITRIECG